MTACNIGPHVLEAGERKSHNVSCILVTAECQQGLMKRRRFTSEDTAFRKFDRPTTFAYVACKYLKLYIHF